MNELKTGRVEDHANRDPITGATGAHPVGVGVGAAVGGTAAGIAAAAATGAATGTVAGPVGTVVGAAVGAVVGALAGKAVAERYDPTVEDAYWRDNYKNEPDYNPEYSYDDYAPAYRLGGESRAEYAGRAFDDVEGDLSSRWDERKGSSKMSWDHARASARAAWNRIGE